MSQVIRCPACGQANSVPDLGSGQKAVCGRCKAPLNQSGGRPVELDDATFRATIGDGRPTVLDLWAPWCGPCRMVAPVLEQLAGERPEIRFAKVNVDENPRTAAEFRAQSIPLLVFIKDGREQGRVVGALPRPQIESAIRQYLG